VTSPLGGHWPPPAPQPKRHPQRLWTALLLAALLATGAIGASRAMRQATVPLSPSLSWTPLLPSTLPTTSPSWTSPAARVAATRPVSAPPRTPHARPRPPRSPGTSIVLPDLPALAAKVDPGLVDINTQLSHPNVQAAGTGIVLDASGVVLTNNHVISGADNINATDIGNGQTYPATVIGYDRVHDIAVLQMEGASDLPTATIGDSGTVAIGDRVAAIGNAGGRGGTPSVAAGTVSALDQTVTVGDEITGSVEQLAGLIEIAADIQPGDSGGPLVDTAGKVIGVDTAGATGSHTAPSTGTGLAIPINDAIGISKQIRTGSASATIHIGATGVLGILVQGTGATAQPGRHARLGYRHRPAAPGVVVTDVMASSPAQQAGLAGAVSSCHWTARRWTPPTRSSLRFPITTLVTRCRWSGLMRRVTGTPQR
jgi:S1-C subfamily serine protease